MAARGKRTETEVEDARGALPAGAAARQVSQLAALYRGPTSTVQCPECLGRGAFERPPGVNGGPPTTYACRECDGTGRVQA